MVFLQATGNRSAGRPDTCTHVRSFLRVIRDNNKRDLNDENIFFAYCGGFDGKYDV